MANHHYSAMLRMSFFLMASLPPVVWAACADTPCLIDTASLLNDHPSLARGITYYSWTTNKPAFGFTQGDCLLADDEDVGDSEIEDTLCVITTNATGPSNDFRQACGEKRGRWFVANIRVDCTDVTAGQEEESSSSSSSNDITLLLQGHATCMAASCTASDARTYFAQRLPDADALVGGGTCTPTVTVLRDTVEDDSPTAAPHPHHPSDPSATTPTTTTTTSGAPARMIPLRTSLVSLVFGAFAGMSWVMSLIVCMIP